MAFKIRGRYAREQQNKDPRFSVIAINGAYRPDWAAMREANTRRMKITMPPRNFALVFAMAVGFTAACSSPKQPQSKAEVEAKSSGVVLVPVLLEVRLYLMPAEKDLTWLTVV